MDLMASTTFVLEPAERTIYTRPPRNAKQDLFDVNMMKGIAVSGLSLFVAVMVPYFYCPARRRAPADRADPRVLRLDGRAGDPGVRHAFQL